MERCDLGFTFGKSYVKYSLFEVISFCEKTNHIRNKLKMMK